MSTCLELNILNSLYHCFFITYIPYLRVFFDFWITSFCHQCLVSTKIQIGKRYFLSLIEVIDVFWCSRHSYFTNNTHLLNPGSCCTVSCYVVSFQLFCCFLAHLYIPIWFMLLHLLYVFHMFLMFLNFLLFCVKYLSNESVIVSSHYMVQPCKLTTIFVFSIAQQLFQFIIFSILAFSIFLLKISSLCAI